MGLLYILEIARSWHNYLTLPKMCLLEEGQGGGGGGVGGHYCSK